VLEEVPVEEPLLRHWGHRTCNCSWFLLVLPRLPAPPRLSHVRLPRDTRPAAGHCLTLPPILLLVLLPFDPHLLRQEIILLLVGTQALVDHVRLQLLELRVPSIGLPLEESFLDELTLIVLFPDIKLMGELMAYL
jgi:hypothetical protein